MANRKLTLESKAVDRTITQIFNHDDIQRIHRLLKALEQRVEKFNRTLGDDLKVTLGKNIYYPTAQFQLNYSFLPGELTDGYKMNSSKAVIVDYYKPGLYDEEIPAGREIDTKKSVYLVDGTYVTNSKDEALKEFDRILKYDIKPTLEKLAGEENVQ